MFTAVKILISALIIGVITEIAHRFPTIGGIIAALPLVSLLSLIWLSFQGNSAEEISKFAMGVLWGFPATAVLILIVALLLRYSFPLSLAMLLGAGGWFLCLKVQGLVFG
ncbi:DUF3147 family protein [Salicibibacter cibarius]|uniref:DUF3147 family protein n=1 Tax=Salicibibacter cibarius TaxID=2743000 RepID=A0A7T6Z7B6_9BACI|nr:DUF3147 family protein [Salicibibacter cibarius]QQK77696.1 DUF3147 family protein [Salicibibacter cibarius]